MNGSDYLSDYLEDLQTQYEKTPNSQLREDIANELSQRSEYSLDLDNLPPVEHLWVDRGLVMSCEGASHPSHRHFKRKR